MLRWRPGTISLRPRSPKAGSEARLLPRLLGQETEYAIRISARDGVLPPSRRVAFDAVAAQIRELVKTGDGRVHGALHAFFVQNGGNFSYEALPWALDSGLLEGATPECRGAAQLVAYQRAQEQILKEALQRVRRASAGEVDIGLLKNGRDAWGHVYGTQENYDVEAARGPWLLLYRLGLVALLPLSLGFLLVSLGYLVLLGAVMLALLPPIVVAMVFSLAQPRWSRSLEEALSEPRNWEGLVWRLTAPLQALGVVWGTPYCWWVGLCLFRRQRRSLTAFLVSRVLLSGTGSLEPDGSFVLSEKATGMRRLIRLWATPAAHAVYDTGNLLKQFMGSLAWWSSYRSLFASRQRWQLGLSDGNRAQVAEYLKVGTALLLLDRVDAGQLEDAPRLRHPLEALRTVCADLSLTTPLALHPHPDLGREATALQLQRWYLERVQRTSEEGAAVQLEEREVQRLWRETLATLETQPDALLGQLDWLTKRQMLVVTSADQDFAVQKKVDLKYHELELGYFDQLERSGLAPRIVSEQEVQRACFEAPAQSPARLRGQLIAELTDPSRAVVGWGQVRLGDGRTGRVVRLDAFRKG